MPDITMLIMEAHEWFRRRFAQLDDARTPADLDAVWQALTERLAIHADAEEAIFYPCLRQRGDVDGEETKDAIRDHNKIRRAIADASAQPVAGKEWHAAVARARSENSAHLIEEEDQALPDFRKHAAMQQRIDLGAEWIRFHAVRSQRDGASLAPVDVQRYLERTKR